MPDRVTRRPARIAAVAAVVMWLAVAGSARAGEGDAPPEFHRDPAKGVPGTVVAVSGRGCSLDGKPAQRATVSLVRLSGTYGPPHYGSSTDYPVAADGSWVGTFTVPEDAPPGPYRMSADCTASDMMWNPIDTDFEVLDPAATTTTTQAPTTTTRAPSTTRPSAPPPTTVVPATTAPDTAVAPPSTDTSLAAATRPPRDDPPDRPGDSSVVPAAIAALAILVGTAGAVAARRRRRAPAT